MSEPTRGLIYRLSVLALIGYVITVRPDTIADFVPILIGLASSSLATRHTTIRRSPHD